MITFQDKVALNENPDIPEINKITDDNINNLKAGINTNETNITNIKNAMAYSTNEVKTDKFWINNKPIYKKVIQIDSLPNNTSTSYSTNIVNGELAMFQAYGKLSSSETTLQSFPYVSPYAGSGNVAINVDTDASNINITTFTDRTSASAFVILEYTKTTD